LWHWKVKGKKNMEKETIEALKSVLNEMNKEYRNVKEMTEFTTSFKEGYEAAVSDLSLALKDQNLLMYCPIPPLTNRR
jgi:hypothetical protein